MTGSRPLISCRELLDFLGAWADGELSAPEREAFEAHLAVCPDCVSYLESYRETLRLEAALGDEAIPEPVPEALVRAVLDSRRR